MFHCQFISSTGEVDNAFFATAELAQRWCVCLINEGLKEELQRDQAPHFVATEHAIMRKLMAQDQYDDLILFFNSHGPVNDAEKAQIMNERQTWGDPLNPPSLKNEWEVCEHFLSYKEVKLTSSIPKAWF
jgi:hypothetical protein